MQREHRADAAEGLAQRSRRNTSTKPNSVLASAPRSSSIQLPVLTASCSLSRVSSVVASREGQISQYGLPGECGSTPSLASSGSTSASATSSTHLTGRTLASLPSSSRRPSLPISSWTVPSGHIQPQNALFRTRKKAKKLASVFSTGATISKPICCARTSASPTR